MPDFSLVLPVLNEEDIIGPVVDSISAQLKKLPISYEIVLVENESTDSSLKVIQGMAKKDKHIVVTTTKRGYGSALIAGIKKASGEYIGYMPSDGQIDVTILPEMWKEVEKKQYDAVKISRKNRESRVRFVRSKIFNILTRILYPIDVIDINGSPRIVAKNKMKQIDLTYPDSFIDTEFAVKAHYLGWKQKELPMKNLDRLGGKSTVQFATVIEFLRNLRDFRNNPQFIAWKKKNNIT